MPQKKPGGWRRLVELLIPPLNVRLSAQMSGGPGPGQVVGSHHLNILFSATKCQRARAIPGKYFCSDHSGFQFRRTTDQTTCKFKCFNFSCCLPHKCRHIFFFTEKYSKPAKVIFQLSSWGSWLWFVKFLLPKMLPMLLPNDLAKMMMMVMMTIMMDACGRFVIPQNASPYCS